MKRAVLPAVALSLVLCGCAEIHKSDGNFAATGVSVNLLFFQIPGDPMALAAGELPDNAEITNVNGSMNDWRTVPGFFKRLLGIGWCQIGGTVKE